MSAISANTIIELYNTLSEHDKKIVCSHIAPQKKNTLESVNKNKTKAITPAALLQKHRLKNKVPAK